MEKTRTELVMQAIGWQGGTVHDLCRELGLDVIKFLNHEPEFKTSRDYILGTYINTNNMRYRKNVIIPKYRGNYDYWIGAAKSMELVNKGYCSDQK